MIRNLQMRFMYFNGSHITLLVFHLKRKNQLVTFVEVLQYSVAAYSYWMRMQNGVEGL